jgi:hypothetical protein
MVKQTEWLQMPQSKLNTCGLSFFLFCKPPPLSFQLDDTTMHVNIREKEKVLEGRAKLFLPSQHYSGTGGWCSSFVNRHSLKYRNVAWATG